MPPIRGASPAPQPAPRRQSERLRQRLMAPTTLQVSQRLPRAETQRALTPPNPDHVHAAQARYSHLNAAFDDPHALATLGRLSTKNARLTLRMPPLRHQMHDLMLQCLPLTRAHACSPEFGQRHEDLERLRQYVALLHQTALTFEYKLADCVLHRDYDALGPLDQEFEQLSARAYGALADGEVILASLKRHLTFIKNNRSHLPPIIAPWRLLPPMEVPADMIAGQQCPLSMAEVGDIAEPLVLPLGEGVQLYSRLELNSWLQLSKQHHVDEYLFLNPTSTTWVRLSQLRRLIIVAED